MDLFNEGKELGSTFRSNAHSGEPLIQAYVWPSPFEDGGGEAQEVWWRCCRWSRVGDTVAVQEKTWA